MSNTYAPSGKEDVTNKSEALAYLDRWLDALRGVRLTDDIMEEMYDFSQEWDIQTEDMTTIYKEERDGPHPDSPEGKQIAATRAILRAFGIDNY